MKISEIAKSLRCILYPKSSNLILCTNIVRPNHATTQTSHRLTIIKQPFLQYIMISIRTLYHRHQQLPRELTISTRSRTRHSPSPRLRQPIPSRPRRRSGTRRRSRAVVWRNILFSPLAEPGESCRVVGTRQPAFGGSCVAGRAVAAGRA